MKISVLYDGPLDVDMDKIIRKGLESVGFEWYGQGTNMITKKRDIGFQLGTSKLSTPAEKVEEKGRE